MATRCSSSTSLPLTPSPHPMKAPLQTRKKIYQSLCYVLSERASLVAWDEFTPADWELFARMADREGVAPLMYWKLKDTSKEVPPSTFNFLRSTYYQTLAQNTLMYRELERILEALDEASIPVIVLKGAALAATVYEDIGLRPMGDLDLLVKRENLDRAAETIKTVGFHRVSKDRIPGLNELIGHAFLLMSNSKQNIAIELHWNLIEGSADWRSPPTDWFWQQSYRVDKVNCRECIGIGWPSLLPVSNLLYLAAHMMLQHGLSQSRLLWLFDINQLISVRYEEIHWNELISRAKTFNWVEAIGITLQEVHNRFKTPVDASALVSFSVQQNKKAWSFIGAKARSPETRFLRELRTLSTLTWWARVLLIFSILFPSPVHVQRQYNLRSIWLSPVFYIYRWMDILMDSLRTLRLAVGGYLRKKSANQNY